MRGDRSAPCQEKTMKKVLVASLLVALASAVSAQDPAYYQEQTLSISLRVGEDLVVETGSPPTPEVVLRQGLYRYTSMIRTARFMTADKFVGDSPPGFWIALDGDLVLKDDPSFRRTVRAQLHVTDADLAAKNVIREGQVSIRFPGVSYTGPVRRVWTNWVIGSLEPRSATQPLPKIRLYQVKLTLEDNLPIQKPLDFFPAAVVARVSPVPVSSEANPRGRIEAGPYEFLLTRRRKDGMGIVEYYSDPQFPMRRESAYEEHYTSVPSRCTMILYKDDTVTLRFGWRLGGEYYNWKHAYSVTLTQRQFADLKAGERVRAQGSCRHDRRCEDEESVRLETTGEFLLQYPGEEITYTGCLVNVGEELLIRENSNDPGSTTYNIVGPLKQALRSFGRRRVTVTGDLRDEVPENLSIDVESFQVELRRDAAVLASTGIVTLPAGTRVTLRSAHGGVCMGVHEDPNGAAQVVSFRLADVKPVAIGESGRGMIDVLDDNQ
jgi:hypothetical protein